MLLRPNAHFAAALERAKADIAGWAAMRRPLLSLHVRRGDSCNPEQVGRRQVAKKRGAGAQPGPPGHGRLRPHEAVLLMAVCLPFRTCPAR